MASILLTSAAPPGDDQWPYPYDQLERMRLSASRDKHGVHTLSDDPTAADVILFVENTDPIRHYLQVRRHPYYREHADKCYLHSRYDHPLPLLPGIYPSIEAGWHKPHWTRSGGYLVAFTNDFAEYDGGTTDRRYLFSFMGAAFNHPLREDLLSLPADNAYLLDTTPYWPYGDLNPQGKAALEEQYQEVALQSQFVVCPRGRGPSSIRLFETMRMGRPPVIVSDAWVPPDGPDWDAFSVRVPEADLSALPDLLAARASEAEDMGRRARAAWADWFSVESTFHRCADACLDMQATRRGPFALHRAVSAAEILRPIHFRALLRTLWTTRTPSPPKIPA
jgi:hypothetical protein